MSDIPDAAEIRRELLADAVRTATGGRDAVLQSSPAEYKALRAKALGAIVTVENRLKMAAEMAAIEKRFHNHGK